MTWSLLLELIKSETSSISQDLCRPWETFFWTTSTTRFSSEVVKFFLDDLFL